MKKRSKTNKREIPYLMFERLQEACENSGMEYKEICEKSKVNEKGLRLFRYGERCPDLMQTVRLCETLGVSLNWLVYGRER